MMTLAVIALAAPTFFTTGPHAATGNEEEALSIGVAVVLIVVYVPYVIYTVFLHREEGGAAARETREEAWSLRIALGVLAAATIGAVVMSELLVGSVGHVVDQFGTTEIFVGVMIIPVVGNAAEHWSAIVAAAHNEMDLSVGISVGSSLQIALFVAPTEL